MQERGNERKENTRGLQLQLQRVPYLRRLPELPPAHLHRGHDAERKPEWMVKEHEDERTDQRVKALMERGNNPKRRL